jgi:hypothetical protein
MNSPRPVRRSPPNPAAALSPWHFTVLGMVALLGTGLLAVLDRSSDRAASSHTELLAHKGVSAPATRTAAPAETALAPLIESPKAPVSVPVPEGAQAGTPASDPTRNLAWAGPRPPDATKAGAVASVSSPFRAMPAAEPQAVEGPVATASLPASAPPARPAASAAAPAMTRGALKTDASAATDCLPPELRTVLADVAARFGEVTVVSTHQLNTINHSSGSIREKLHHDCKAVDIRPDRTRIDEIKAYLRGRQEIGGIESYRNGIVHLDVSNTAVASARPRARSPQASAELSPADAVQAAAPQQNAPAPSLFTPVVPERYR